jgi:hypothetical protein
MTKRHAVEFICSFVTDRIICNIRAAVSSGTLLCISVFVGIVN